MLHSGGSQRVGRTGFHGGEQTERGIECAGVALHPRGRELALRAPPGLRGQARCTLEQRGRGREAAAGSCSAGRPLEILRDRLVEGGRGVRPVPGAPIGVERRVGRVGERTMNLPPLVDRGDPVRRSAHERMPEPHPGTELDQAGLFGRRPRSGTQTERRGSSPEDRRVAERLCGGRQKEEARLGRQLTQPSQETGLDPARNRRRVGRHEAGNELRSRQCARQLEQREGVSPRLRDDPLADPRVDRALHDGVEERACVGRAQASDRQIRKPGQREVVGGLAHGDHDRDALCEQAAGNECDRLQRDRIEPLSVVDEADQRLVLRELGQQIEDGEPDEEPVGSLPRRQAEGGSERVALRAGEPAQLVEERAAELVQPAVGELQLRLDPDGAGDPERPGARFDVVEESRLADAGLAAKDEDRAAAGSGVREQGVQPRAFAAAPVQPSRLCGDTAAWLGCLHVCTLVQAGRTRPATRDCQKDTASAIGSATTPTRRVAATTSSARPPERAAR